jgi:four helix bundle protein
MQNANHRPKELEERMIAFAASVVSLSSKLPRNLQGRHICDQILRSGTATAANYGEARAAESRSDFIHKLKIVSKELNETAVWLEIIVKSRVIPAETVAEILAENRELCRIISASIRTARAASS